MGRRQGKRQRKRRKDSTSELASKPAKRSAWEWMLPLGSGALIAAMFATLATHYVMSAPSPQPLATQPERSAAKQFPSLGELAAMSNEELAKQDLARVNLCCAKELPGAEKIDLRRSLQTLDAWAKHIKAETDRHLYRVRDPRFADLYQKSESFFRASMMLQVLQQDLKVHYNHDRIDDVDFTQSKDLFIHGMINNDNGGTCVSMPVLYTVMGRRLGYPIKLVLAKEHVFCRWEGPKNQFNIEGSGEGFGSYDNDHYTKWPKPMSPAEIKSGNYLQSLTPRKELAVFLAARGHCLQDNGRLDECLVAYAQANQLAPKNPVYGYFLTEAMMQRPDMQAMVAKRVEKVRTIDRFQAANQARLRAAQKPWQSPPQPSQNFGPPNAQAPHQTGYQPPNAWNDDANTYQPGIPTPFPNPHNQLPQGNPGF